VVYDAAITWASKAERTNYWKPFRDSPNVDIPTSPARRLSVTGQRPSKSSMLDKSTRTEEYSPTLSHPLTPPFPIPLTPQCSHSMVSVVDYRDEQYLSKLRGLGMSPEDEWKLYALRQHIFKISQLQLKYPLHPLFLPSFCVIRPVRG